MDKVLELKHLAPYLPFRSKIISTRTHEIDEVEWVSFSKNHIGRHEEYPNESDGCILTHRISEIKPILRPPSDIIKYIEPLGIVPARLFCGEPNNKIPMSDEYAKCMEDINNKPYWWVQKLLEWQMDVFGLIESGLAVDVNQLEENPYK